MEQEKVYIGAKLIRACPMSKQDFNVKKGILLSYHEFHVTPIPGYQVTYPDGYVSWSPQATFEEAYRLVSDAEKKLIF